MKSPEEAVARVRARIGASWSQVVAGAAWAPDFKLGSSRLTGRSLETQWPDVHRTAMRWDTWIAIAPAGISLRTRSATAFGTPQPLPATLVVASIDAAAALVGAPWPDRLARARMRCERLHADFPRLVDPAAVLRATDTYSDVDFDVACRVGAWFRDNPTSGLTARQVPVVGMGTKWLAARMGVIRCLAGLQDLGLERGRPMRVHLTYLDPKHLDTGRRHDLATVGDINAIAYQPEVVLISENRDTAQLFPAVSSGVAIEGEGRGAAAIAALSWVRAARELWYWGDMDADGLEILHSFRAAGLPVRSIFMDMASYTRWERYGVDHDHRGRPLGPRQPREVGELNPQELELYHALCSPSWSRHRRIEQERIPLDDPVAVISGW